MLNISVKTDIDKLLPKLAAVGSRQAPFAVAMALTKTGQKAQAEVKKAMPNVFDRPTPYTLNSTYLRPATKTRLEALVKIKDEAFKGIPANKYLHAQAFGGGRNLKRSERSLQIKGHLKDGLQVVPGSGMPLDAYGNVRSGQMTRILSAVQASSDPYQNQTKASLKRSRSRKKAEYFVGAPAGGRLPLGVYERKARQIKPMLLFVKPGRYKKRLPFHDIVARVTREEFEAQLYLAIQRALATAR